MSDEEGGMPLSDHQRHRLLISLYNGRTCNPPLCRKAQPWLMPGDNVKSVELINIGLLKRLKPLSAKVKPPGAETSFPKLPANPSMI